MLTQSQSFEFLGNDIPSGQRPPWDTVLFESDNFVAIPTVGALLEGWLLIVPRKFTLCFGNLPAEQVNEFLSFKSEVVNYVRDAYGPVAVFEHGPSHQGSTVGCSVDHAHLHVVPARFDLFESISQVFDDHLNWERSVDLESARRKFERQLPYLYVEQPIGNGFITTHPNFPSQLVRRAIARSIDRENEFEWRKFPMLENVLRTIDRFGAKSTFDTRYLEHECDK